MDATARMYPTAPLGRFCGPEGATYRALMRLGLPRYRAARVSKAGGWLTQQEADFLACKVGSHLDLLWPEVDWIDRWAEDELEDVRAWVARYLARLNHPSSHKG